MNRYSNMTTVGNRIQTMPHVDLMNNCIVTWHPFVSQRNSISFITWIFSTLSFNAYQTQKKEKKKNKIKVVPFSRYIIRSLQWFLIYFQKKYSSYWVSRKIKPSKQTRHIATNPAICHIRSRYFNHNCMKNLPVQSSLDDLSIILYVCLDPAGEWANYIGLPKISWTRYIYILVSGGTLK
jgi:hypothetical protein